MEELKKIRSPRLVNLRDRLYSEWRDWLAEESVEAGFRGEDSQPATWVEGLVDAVWEGRDASRSFRRFIQEWLAQAERSLGPGGLGSGNAGQTGLQQNVYDVGG